MTSNKRRVRDRFTFSLTGMPVVSSYASMPVIPDDRIRMRPKKGPKGPQAAQGQLAKSPRDADALPAGCA